MISMGRILSLLLRTFFHLLYHEFAWTYDVVAKTVSVGLWYDWVFASLPFLTGPRILEIGPGTGHLLEKLCRDGHWVVGLDVSRWMCVLCFERLVDCRGFWCVVNGYAQFVPFGESSFDQVVSTFPSNYILDPHSLAEVFRVLKPGGSLIVLPFAWITGRRWQQRLASWLFRITGESPAWIDHFTRPLERAGFIARIQFITLPSSKVAMIIATKRLL